MYKVIKIIKNKLSFCTKTNSPVNRYTYLAKDYVVLIFWYVVPRLLFKQAII